MSLFLIYAFPNKQFHSAAFKKKNQDKEKKCFSKFKFRRRRRQHLPLLSRNLKSPFTPNIDTQTASCMVLRYNVEFQFVDVKNVDFI
jgi:hypothetical protein